MVLVIPQHFTPNLMEGKSSPVQFLVDGSFTTIARTVHSYLDATNQAFNAGLASRFISARLGISQAQAFALIQPSSIDVR